MRYCRLNSLVLAFVLSSGAVFAQDSAGNKKPRTPEDYQPRTVREIISMEPDPEDLNDKQERLVVTRNDLPSRVRVTFTGKTRRIPELKRQVIRQWARLYAGAIEHYTEPYQSEMLFIENGASYWLAIRKGSAFSAKRQFKKGEVLELYLIRLGATMSKNNFDWALLVEDVRKAGTH
ncbi:MAG: hypothetical protein ABR555_11665 [Pyrinomonadaceae bacterium]